jgi:hypothetical protein
VRVNVFDILSILPELKNMEPNEFSKAKIETINESSMLELVGALI